MKKIVAFAMIVSMVLGCLVISASADTKAEYVKDGLVAWYDATNNSNGTHDVQADLWKDLSGNANHIDISSAVSNNQITWDKGALIIKDGGCYLQLPEAVVKVLEGDAYTIEIVTGDLEFTATAYITLLSSANDELSVFIRCGEEHAPGQPNQFKLEYKNQDANGDSNRPFMYDAWDAFNGKTLAVTSDLKAFDGERSGDGDGDKDNVFMYSDGTKLAQGESEYNMDLDYVYLGHTASNREWHGEIYPLRIYNRALTADEVTANAEADANNYRSNKTFEPTQEYDPKLDENYVGFVKLEGYTNDRVVFNKDTDLIPLTGFTGSVGLLDYLYPYESDEPWTGARLQLSEGETDYDGNAVSGCNFTVLYSSFCTRASIDLLPGKDAQFVVLKFVLQDGEFTDMSCRAVGSESAEITMSSDFGGIDASKTGEVQYLIFDISEVFDEEPFMFKFVFDIAGMTEDCIIDLHEIAIFKTGKEAYEYAGEEWEDTTKAPATEKPTEAPTDPVTEPTTTAPETTAPETEAPKSGCGAVVGFGAAAILTAAAAAVVLKKKD
jgi:hypothetical protein